MLIIKIKDFRDSIENEKNGAKFYDFIKSNSLPLSSKKAKSKPEKI